MSTTNTHQQLDRHTRQAQQTLDAIFQDPEICNHCLSKKRRYYTEYEESVAEHLVGKNTTVLEMRGHRVNDEGTLLVDSTATSDPDPDTFFEVVPPKKDEKGNITEPARAYSICKCGVVDYDEKDSRTSTELFEAAENVGEWLEENTDWSFNTDAAKRAIGEFKDRGLLVGNDEDVLQRMIKIGLKHSSEF